MTYQPKTGARCSCKRGVQRDNCPNCEGTGIVIDFAAIRRAAHVRTLSHRKSPDCTFCDANGNWMGTDHLCPCVRVVTARA